MDAAQLWAAVKLSAQNGNTESLLDAAAQARLHLYDIHPLPGGFQAGCAAWRYKHLSRLARKRRVRLHVQKRFGMFFWLRPVFRRTGLWIGIAFFLPLLFGAKNLVWAVDYVEMTPGQQARAAAVLREHAGLQPGTYITQSLLSTGEYALLQSGEFSWASLNFFGGRLTVEAAAAKSVPEIFSGRLQGLRAKTGGVVTELNLKSGTALVSPGQEVVQGQELIGTARSERDGTLIYEPAAGTVTARFDWSAEYQQPLSEQAPCLSGERNSIIQLSFLGQSITIPTFSLLAETTDAGTNSNHLTRTRHLQAEIAGLPLPISIKETTSYMTQLSDLSYPDDFALAMARLYTLRQLEAEYPGAELIARKEKVQMESRVLHYSVTYTIAADIAN